MHKIVHSLKRLFSQIHRMFNFHSFGNFEVIESTLKFVHVVYSLEIWSCISGIDMYKPKQKRSVIRSAIPRDISRTICGLSIDRSRKHV